jgi:arylsulfatase A-like enzyme
MMDDYYTHLRNGRNYMRLNAEVDNPAGHATDVFTDWACAYLEERAKVGGPFFLYLAYNAPHDPIQPKPEWLERVRQRAPGLPEKRARLVALIEHLDDGIGHVLATLERTGLATNTLVVFSSDNGGVLQNGANNGPWRGEKGHVYEGGLRVPCAARWPGHIQPGSSTDRAALTMDLFATVCAVAGVTPPQAIDGVSLLPTLTGAEAPSFSRDVYFVRREGGMGYGGKTIEAFCRGDWKLVQDSPYAPLELYNLKTDPQEAKNLAGTERAVVNALDAALRVQIQRGGAVPWQAPGR